MDAARTVICAEIEHKQSSRYRRIGKDGTSPQNRLLHRVRNAVICSGAIGHFIKHSSGTRSSSCVRGSANGRASFCLLPQLLAPPARASLQTRLPTLRLLSKLRGLLLITQSMSSLEAARQALHQLSDPARAKVQRGFFKNSAEDIFLGVPPPSLRKIAKAFAQLPLAGIRTLMQSAIHEERSLANEILCLQFRNVPEAGQKKIFDFYTQPQAHPRMGRGRRDRALYRRPLAARSRQGTPVRARTISAPLGSPHRHRLYLVVHPEWPRG